VIANLTSLPSIFVVESGARDRVGDILDSHGLSTNRALIVCGQAHSLAIAAKVARQFKAADIEKVRDYSENEVARLSGVLAAARSTLIVAIGGGGVIDVAKRVSKTYGVSCLVMPAVVSNDGLMSPISVLRTKQDRLESLPAAMPIGVIADLDVIMTAPHRYLRASGGDLLSNLSATSDWRHLVERGEGPLMNDIAYHLSRNSAEALVHWRNCDVTDPAFVRNLIIAQIYSGIAMSIAGTSRPCSGPEHLISHALDELNLTQGVLHGVQVGSACLFTLHLLGELTPDILGFAEAMRIPCCWSDLLADPGQARVVLQHARKVRPDRRTILDYYSDEQLLIELARYNEHQHRLLRISGASVEQPFAPQTGAGERVDARRDGASA
jgi:glycerol-1-phosphate dehydrogenase [NAD(P)+]